MVISVMHTEFLVGIDKATTLNSPNFEPEERDIFLNNSIEKFISQRMYGTNPKREGFEETQKRYDDLITLVNQQNFSAFSSSPLVKPNGQVVTFPTDYWHTIQEEADITYLDCNSQSITTRVPVMYVTHERYNKIIRDPFHKPNENKVIRLGIGGSPELITGTGITLAAYYLRYIKKPAVVQYGTAYALPTTDIDCDLPEHTHKEIVAMAVAEALGNIESQRYPIKTQEVTTIE